MTIHPISAAMNQKMTMESHKSETEVKQSGGWWGKDKQTLIKEYISAKQEGKQHA